MPFQNLHDIKVLKMSDSDVLDRIKRLAESTGVRFERVQFNYSFKQGDPTLQAADLNTNTEWKLTLEQKSRFINWMTFHFADNTNVRIGRNNDNHFDSMNINYPGNHELPHYFKFSTTARDLFGEAEIIKTLPNLISQEAKEDMESRKSGLVQLESMGRGFFERLKDMTSAQYEALNKLRDEGEARIKARTEELTKEHKAKVDTVTAREAELDAHRREIDDRSNRHARRQLRTDLKGTFKARADSFKLSFGTRALRLPIACLYVLLMFAFGYGIYQCNQKQAKVAPQQYDWVLIVQQAALAVGLAVTAGFFIRWNDSWFREHASEEFKLKRLEIDVDRASWICEMALEWKAEAKAEMPQLLMERLSQNIFIDDSPKHEPTSNADTLASAILGTASEVNVRAGNTEIKLDRKSMAKLGEKSN